jgi:hypothetical protein
MPSQRDFGAMTPDSLEAQHTLATAIARYDELRTRDMLASAATDMTVAGVAAPAPLQKEEALELLALGELIARKAGYGRELTVRSARAAGASWSQIGAAIGTSKQSAWESHNRWIDQQASQHGRIGYAGMDEQQAAAARLLAGSLAEEPME